jgi:hypothetical protein
MRIKSKKGMTAMIDAMIFIVVMGLAVAALCYIQDDRNSENDASDIVDRLFHSKMRIDDIIEENDSKVMPLSDLVAASMIIGDGAAASYLEETLDCLMNRPDSYSMRIVYKGIETNIGSGEGIPTSSTSRDIIVLYGDALHIELCLY